MHAVGVEQHHAPGVNAPQRVETAHRHHIVVCKHLGQSGVVALLVPEASPVGTGNKLVA